jgi:hypothetical protein
MMGRQKKTGKPVSPQQKISTGTRGEWRKQIFWSRIQQNKDKLCQRNQWSPQEQSKRRNTTGNQWKFYRDDTGYGQPKCTGDTQEIPRQQK